MLALASPISNFHSLYSPEFIPGVQFALDLTENNAGMSERDGFVSSRSQDTALRPVADNTSAFSFQNRFNQWPQAPYDPFAGDLGGRITPERSERMSSRMPPEIHSVNRAPVTSAVGESYRRPLSFVSQSSAFISDPGSYTQLGQAPRSNPEDIALKRQSQDSFTLQSGSPSNQAYIDYDMETQGRRGNDLGRAATRYHTRRRPFNQDEFDGPSQLLPLPVPQQEHARSQALPSLPVHLEADEQDEIITRVNDTLSRCAFHFVAKYQFPIPLERDKPRVRTPADREWTEWAYLLKRLATKRRIPARVLFDNQIKQFVTTLENSIAVRSNSRDQQPRIPKDDRYMLQLVSAATQVARILMDSLSMEQLDNLYRQTENVILERRARLRELGFQ